MTTNTTQQQAQDNAPAMTDYDPPLGVYSRKALDGFLEFCADNDRLTFNVGKATIYTSELIDDAPRYCSEDCRGGLSRCQNERPANMKEWAGVLIDSAPDEALDGVDVERLRGYLIDTLPCVWRDYLRQKSITPDAAERVVYEAAQALQDEAQRLVAGRLYKGADRYKHAARYFAAGKHDDAKEATLEAWRYFRNAAKAAQEITADLLLLASITPPPADGYVAGGYPIEDLRRIAKAQGKAAINAAQESEAQK